MPTKENLELGRKAEELAGNFLKKNGYRVLEKNFRCRYGEIDIIARDKKAICFVEVKSRSNFDIAAAKEAVNSRKIGQISKASLEYLKQKSLLDKKARFDVICVGFGPGEPSLEIIKDAFELKPNYQY